MKGHDLTFFKRIDGGILVVAALVMFAIQPLLKPGLPTAADLNIHMIRTLEFERAQAPGVLFPRWAPNLVYGYGYPLFIFAAPLTYIFTALLHFNSITLEMAFKLLLILAILFYGVGMYLLARDLWRSWAAGLIAATAFVFAPFSLREALLVGGNLPQYLAIGFFPWTLWAALRADRSSRMGWIILAGIFYAGVILSHLFHALIFTPILGFFILFLLGHRIIQTRLLPASGYRLLKPVLILPIGLLLSAFFWIPVLVERSYTRAEADVYLEKSPFFIRYPHWPELVAWIQPLDFRAANPYVPLTLGLVTLVLAALGFLFLFHPRRPTKDEGRKTKDQGSLQGSFSSFVRLNSGTRAVTDISLPYPPFIIFFALLAGGSIFMALPLSQPVWQTVEVLQVAQFPWRMLGPANLGLAVLAGLAILWVPASMRPWATAVCIAVQLWAVAPFLYPVTPFVERGTPTLADQITYERSSQLIGTTTLGEFLPKTVSRVPTTSPLVDAFAANTNPERLDRDSLPPTAGARLLEQTAVSHRYQIDSPTAFTLRLFHFDYPGWQATLDDRPVAIRPEAETGLMLIDIPAGQHTLHVYFGETLPRQVGLILSGATVLGVLVIGFWQLSRKKRDSDGQVRPAIHSLALNSTSLGAVLLIIIAALWLKPLLEPLFTVRSPPDLALPAQYQTDIQFANGITLIGYDLSRRVVEPGGYLQVALYWQTDRGPYRVNLQPFVHLDRLDTFTTVVGATNYTPGDVTTEMNMPTFHWDNARYIRDEHDLILPPDTPPLAYAVRVGLIDSDTGQLVELADGGGDTAWLDTINVSPKNNRPVDLARSVDVSFSGANGDTIHLAGYETTGLTEEQLTFSLLWQIDDPLQTNYTIFAQLLDAQGQLVSSFDRPPLDGAYPTSTWLPNQPILDPRHIPVAGVPPGDYRLIVGLYDPDTGQRLTVPGGLDFAEISRVNIQAKTQD